MIKKLLAAILWPGLLCSQTIGVESFATGFETVSQISHAGDTRLFVAEQTGKVKVLNANGSVNPTPFLTIPSSELVVGAEAGLIGLAFHPNYATNGYFYITYIRSGDNYEVVKRFSVSSNPNVADANSGTVILEVPPIWDIHKSGNLVFGPDGYLYIAIGDNGGGSANAQNTTDFYGKLLRIDVNSGTPFGIPPSNPFVGVPGNDAIFAYGLRNAWKFSFDRLTGDLWLSDVGQGEIEEVNKLEAPITTAWNMGWPCFEGDQPYTDVPGCDNTPTLVYPFAQYHHVEGNQFMGCAITGGYVYRGTQYPAFNGIYFFGDYCRDQIGTVQPDGTLAFTTGLQMESWASSLGEDLAGELYIAANGTIYKIKDTDMNVDDYAANQGVLTPNPAHSALYYHGGGSFPFEVTTFDLSGRQIRSFQLNSESQNILQGLNLESGIYVFELKDVNGFSQTKKVIIR